MKTLLFVCFVILGLGVTVVAWDVRPASGDDPVVEARLMNLSKELRCLVCQNETLADSQAGLAEDLRREIREQIRAGKSDKEIISFLTQRYGQFILYRPQVTPATYLLWFGPFVGLIGGLLVLFLFIRNHRDSVKEQPLSTEDRRRADELLTSDSRKETA